MFYTSMADFWNVASPSLMVAHSIAFEALCGKFWINRSMVGWCYKANLQCVNFLCALSLQLQMGATFSSPIAKQHGVMGKASRGRG
jgi:hypothetical protein